MQDNPGFPGATGHAVHHARRLGLALVFTWFFLGGIGHFALTGSFVSIVPPYVPFPAQVVYGTGVLEILGALGVLLRVTRARAGIGLALLTVAVTPANIHMLLHAELFPQASPAFYALRLVFQGALLAIIIASTRAGRGGCCAAFMTISPAGYPQSGLDSACSTSRLVRFWTKTARPRLPTCQSGARAKVRVS